jgi:hypothetical protein
MDDRRIRALTGQKEKLRRNNLRSFLLSGLEVDQRQ